MIWNGWVDETFMFYSVLKSQFLRLKSGFLMKKADFFPFWIRTEQAS